MASVVIGTVSYPVYGSIEDADAYLAASFRLSGAWAALTYEQRKQVLVEVTRNFEFRTWRGAQVSSSQDLAWPRTGTFGTNVTPTVITQAFFLMAGLVALNPTLLGTGSTAPPLQSLREGPVAASFFFTPAIPAGTIEEVDKLLAPYLGSDSATYGSMLAGGVSGMDAESELEDLLENSRGLS